MDITNSYIDIHTHILPGVDDGPAYLIETIRMLKMEYEQGVKAIIATPHYIPGKKNMPADQLQNIRDIVQEEAEKIAPDFKILLGNELLYSESVIEDLQAGKALTLANSRYVLVEFETAINYDKLFKAIADLTCAGYIPVIAHVERYQCLHRKDYLISDLIDAGCYIQMNASSLVGNIFSNFDAIYNIKLVRQGLVHFIGSDCHDIERRKPCIIEAAKVLEKKCDIRQANRLCIDNPSKVLKNTYI